VTSGSLALPRDELLFRARRVAAAWDGAVENTLPHALDLLIGRSVLLADSPDGIQFRHQLLFEYVAARALIARGGAAELRRLHGIVEERPLDLFTGAVFEQAMIYAWNASRTLRPHLTAVLTALAESPSVNLQSMALVVAAYHPDIEADVVGLLRRAGPETVRRFVELTPRVSGRKIGRTLVLLRRVWERAEPMCHRAVLNVLERFALQHGQAVRDFVVDEECVQRVVQAKGDLLLSQRALPRTVGLLAQTDPALSAEALLTLFEAGCVTTNNRALAVAILDIVADRWAYFGSDRTLARFTLAVCRARRRNDGQEVEAVRRAGGRLFASYWADLYRLGGPQPLAEEWLVLVATMCRRLAATSRAPLRIQLRLMGMAQALTLIPNGHPLIEQTLTWLFPPVDDSYGLPLLELPASFLVPLLRSASPAGDRTRALIRAALTELPADPAQTDDPASLRVSVDEHRFSPKSSSILSCSGPAHASSVRGQVASSRIWPVERGNVFGAGPPAVGGRLRPAPGRVLPLLLPPVGQQIDQRKGVAELLGATAAGVPGAIHGVAIAKEHIDSEPAAGRRADVAAEWAVRCGIPGHSVPGPPPVGECLLDRALGDDDEPGVVAVQELQPGELRGEPCAARALPLLAGEPHVVVDDQL